MKRELLWDRVWTSWASARQRVRSARFRHATGIAARQLAAAVEERDGVLLFPEGTRFSSAKRERAGASGRHRTARSSQHARRLQHVLPPRRSGVLALETVPTLTRCSAQIGFEGAASLNDIWGGKLIGRTVRLCFWRVPSAEIPRTAEDRAAWLDAQWARVDAWVAAQASGRPEVTST
jgi:hypothetical protein